MQTLLYSFSLRASRETILLHYHASCMYFFIHVHLYLYKKCYIVKYYTQWTLYKDDCLNLHGNSNSNRKAAMQNFRLIMQSIDTFWIENCCVPFFLVSLPKTFSNYIIISRIGLNFKMTKRSTCFEKNVLLATFLNVFTDIFLFINLFQSMHTVHTCSVLYQLLQRIIQDSMRSYM